MTEYERAALVAGELVDERYRQQTDKGYTVGHDVDVYRRTMDLAKAAAAYAISAAALPGCKFTDWLWPWRNEAFKPRSSREDLVRAGALIIAQIQVIDAQERGA